MNSNSLIWRCFIVAGAVVGAYGGWQIISGQFSRSIGIEVVALGLVVIGLLSCTTLRRGRN